MRSGEIPGAEILGGEILGAEIPGGEIHGAGASSSRTVPTAVLGVIANGAPGDIASVKGFHLPA